MPTTPLPPLPKSASKIDRRAPFSSVPPGATYLGITLYDWLAAIAMQGLVTHGMEVQADRAMTEEDKDNEMAQRAYRIADAMLRAREQAISSTK